MKASGRSPCVIFEGERRAAQRDVHCHHYLFDRREPVEPVWAHVAHQVQHLFAGEVHGRDAVQHLLISGVGRIGRAPVVANQRRDRRAVDDVERIERTVTRKPGIEGQAASTTSMSSSSMRSQASKVWRRSGGTARAVRVENRRLRLLNTRIVAS